MFFKKQSASAKMGFKCDQEGIFLRYARERENWLPHLNNCKNTILQCIPKNCKNIAVLGSGWLLDFPIEELQLKNDTSFFLIDIEHPIQIQKKLRLSNNYKFLNQDITNGAVDCSYKWSLTKNDIAQLTKNLETLPLLDISNFDFIISLNVLNQLDILICDYLQITKNVSESSLREIRTIIQSKHIEALKTNKSLLITDVNQINTDLNNNKQSIHSLIQTPLPETNKIAKWEWDFDSNGTYLVQNKVKMHVEAYLFNDGK